MHGTVPQKIGRVISSLVLHPEYISRCLSHNVLSSKTPLDLEIPWFSYAAIDFLENYLDKSMTVFEYGSGGSTIFFARRVKSVLSVEDSDTWYELVNERLRAKGLNNASLKLRPYDFKSAVDFEQSDYLNAIPGEKFGVIVVDGMEEWTLVRPVCFAKAEKHIKKGGIIIVDDSWRYPELRERNHATDLKIFQSVGPSRPGVTSTDVFFY